MPEYALNLKVVIILTLGFAGASLLGYITQKAKFSPILGYLIAGYLIGPYSPGFVADLDAAEQLAEIGVILMMFGVGMHFKWQDLVFVKGIAIPGALIQTFMATVASTFLVHYLGWGWNQGVVVGLAIGVASTVVMVRLLSDNHILHTKAGHIAVGWLIVEDILTVGVLLLLPSLAEILKGESLSPFLIIKDFGFAIAKFLILVGVMFTIGQKICTYILIKVARTKSHELFTLTILAMTFMVAVGSALIFGTSIALGAFISGMVIGQTDVKHQASVNSLPLQDTFVVIFFLTVGMLFDPSIIFTQLTLFLGVLAIIILVKPIAAFLIVVFLKYPIHIAITVAFALAQIGEFSFILAEEAIKLKILSDDAYDVIVACAIVSIALNPLLFRIANRFNFKEDKKGLDNETRASSNEKDRAIIVGFGPVGQMIRNLLEANRFRTVIVDKNVDTITKLREEGKDAIFGDAATSSLLTMAEVQKTKLLILTFIDPQETLELVKIALELNPSIKIIAQIRDMEDKLPFQDYSVELICGEEESIKAFKKSIIEHLENKPVPLKYK